MAAPPLSPDRYTPCLNDVFVLHDKLGASAHLTLVSVDPGFDNEDQFSFSLVFKETGNTPRQQSLYTLSHPKLGEFDLFLVPIRRKGGGILYEAVFNLLKDETR